ncbi:MAG: alpha-N-arabinofuranosidase [Opitutaceae bacterium]|jgi:alpha-N-arabinofuranosidase|nr:alpha-N-arabinofuranosidase [Opitutaceae bacterium]
MNGIIKAKVHLDREFRIARIDNRIYGSFAEHLGRCIYGGLYQPDHDTADGDGFRQDVLKLVNELQVPVVRYPGGNFVSGYNWQDGIGPKANRPRKAELAWRAIETNEVGIDEFAKWCRKAGASPMMAINLGTRGADEARNIVEYCNLAGGSSWADLRRKHGNEAPHNIKLWCLGNEMDGPWQIGHKTATEYARLANESAKVMKRVDPDIELVACGSSHRGMPTFAEWERLVLEETYDNIDYISLHSYYGNQDGDVDSFLASSMNFDTFIRDVVAICNYVKARKRGKKDIHLSFDEWNVWYHSREADKKLAPWQIAPDQLADVYDLADALVVGSLLNSLIRHSDRVKIACYAQLVNVIAPIMTANDGGAWRQTIFYPIQHTSHYGRGVALMPVVEADHFSTRKFDDVPRLDTSAVWDDTNGYVTLFALNRDRAKPMALSVDLRSFGECRVAEHIVLTGDDLAAVNTRADPDRIKPRTVSGGHVDGGILSATLPNQSWNVLRVKTG